MNDEKITEGVFVLCIWLSMLLAGAAVWALIIWLMM